MLTKIKNYKPFKGQPAFTRQHGLNGRGLRVQARRHHTARRRRQTTCPKSQAITLLADFKHSTPMRAYRYLVERLPMAPQRGINTFDRSQANFPNDNGATLINRISDSGTLYCISDASMKDGHATHAWIVSSGEVDSISDPTLTIFGSGPVDRYSQYLSSTRAELTGITAISIIVRLFVKFHSYKPKIQITCNNKGVIFKIPHISLCKFRAHHEANYDLFNTQRDQTKGLPITFSWVKRYADKAPWNTIDDLKQ